jgi:hypothetical protein
MADLDASHPITRSFSSVYWRGGDKGLETLLFRPQYFDKLVAWGGESAIRGVLQYVGPGLELVSFDPKVSISLIGREAFRSDEVLDEVAERAACDVANFNQEGCVSSRYQFVEGTTEQVDRFCERLVGRLGVDRELGSARGPKVPREIRDEVEILRMLEPIVRVWGSYDGDDPLASRGVQRVVALGEAHEAGMGMPHDGMYPLHRFVRWIVDNSTAASSAP